MPQQMVRCDETVHVTMQGRSRVVQTALTAEEYEALRRVADSRDVSLKEAAREALVQWVVVEGGGQGSAIFDFEEVVEGGPRTDSSDDDTTLYRRRRKRVSS
jgi:hypothetical protein